MAKKVIKQQTDADFIYYFGNPADLRAFQAAIMRHPEYYNLSTEVRLLTIDKEEYVFRHGDEPPIKCKAIHINPELEKQVIANRVAAEKSAHCIAMLAHYASLPAGYIAPSYSSRQESQASLAQPKKGPQEMSGKKKLAALTSPPSMLLMTAASVPFPASILVGMAIMGSIQGAQYFAFKGDRERYADWIADKVAHKSVVKGVQGVSLFLLLATGGMGFPVVALAVMSLITNATWKEGESQEPRILPPAP